MCGRAAEASHPRHARWHGEPERRAGGGSKRGLRDCHALPSWLGAVLGWVCKRAVGRAWMHCMRARRARAACGGCFAWPGRLDVAAVVRRAGTPRPSITHACPLCPSCPSQPAEVIGELMGKITGPSKVGALGLCDLGCWASSLGCWAPAPVPTAVACMQQLPLCHRMFSAAAAARAVLLMPSAPLLHCPPCRARAAACTCTGAKLTSSAARALWARRWAVGVGVGVVMLGLLTSV